MNMRLIIGVVCFLPLCAFSQGYTGDLEIPDKNRVYYFRLNDGVMDNLVYTMIEDADYIHSMYLADSILLSGIDSLTMVNKKDSILTRFLGHFSGTYVEYTKKGKLVAASYYPKPTSLDTAFYKPTEDQRMTFYPNGNPYAQFYQKNGQPAKSIIFFTREGEVDFITDLSQHAVGEEVSIRNPYDYRLRKEQLTIVIQ